MARLNILRYPDARLHKVAAPVTVFDDGLKKLVADMAETMYAAPGIGLAAIQVDVPKQVIVVDVSERRDSLVVLVNPEIVEARIEGSGAGMDPPDGARLVDGFWRWRPALPPLKEVVMRRSGATADWRICLAGQCRPMGDYLPDDADPVTLKICN